MTKIKSVLPILTLLLGMFLAGGAARAADLVVPDPSIAPEEVVAIQMKALQFNDNPSPDFGIAQTWNFAHRATAMTGPLPRFANMLKGPAYGLMLNHASHGSCRFPATTTAPISMCLWKPAAGRCSISTGLSNSSRAVNSTIAG